MENSLTDPQNLKVELVYDPAIPLLGIYPKELKTEIQIHIHTPVFIVAFFTTPITTDGWLNKM